MKNKIIIILLIFIYCEAPAQSKYNLKVIYSTTSQKNKDNSESQDHEEMFLLMGENESFYMHPNKFIRDSILLNLKEKKSNMQNMSQAQIQNLVNNLPKTPNVPVKYAISKTKDSLIFTTKSALDTFIYFEKLPNFNWSIQSEEKQLLGFTCSKARGSFRGREYIAWFTSEIPSPNGPHKFGGLPGLILEIHDTENHYTFKAKSIENKTGIVPQYTSSFNVEITSADKIKDATFNTYISSVHAMISDPERQAKIIARETKKYENFNNPLELIFESEK